MNKNSIQDPWKCILILLVSMVEEELFYPITKLNKTIINSTKFQKSWIWLTVYKPNIKTNDDMMPQMENVNIIMLNMLDAVIKNSSEKVLTTFCFITYCRILLLVLGYFVLVDISGDI